MHDGAFTSLEAAIRHHLDVVASARGYDPATQGLDADLSGPIAPLEPMLDRLDPLLAAPQDITEQQLDALVAFVANGLLDPRAEPNTSASSSPTGFRVADLPLRSSSRSNANQVPAGLLSPVRPAASHPCETRSRSVLGRCQAQRATSPHGDSSHGITA